MALPNVISPWSIFYSKDQLLRKEKKESLEVFYFLKLNIQIQLIVREACAKTCQGIVVYGMFGLFNFEIEMFEFQFVNTKNWNLKFVCEMFGVWKFEN
jgi:hypothetical protein